MTKKLRCAVYTRKSSEEGLDQEFNSLDAQREACLAYIASQKGEGWSPSPSRYDDGGWSGGNMERPGLQKLLADIRAGRIDVVVVYKVDRLTRSLSDFARIVELFDQHKVSFVSVTQAFNTTSSMGRLTLNVLLSFAQFEREVTGERIRDKIAASKARGMWMGGFPPLGYLPRERRLEVVAEEAELVRSIFRRYLETGSVHVLARQLAAEGIRSKQWITSGGKTRGGAVMNRGALFHLLRNRIYLGEISHREKTFPGQHDPIVDRALFEEVQARLDANIRRRKATTADAAPLTGLLFDAGGSRMSPVHSRGRSGKQYRYYTSTALQKGAGTTDGVARRIPAAAIEELLLDRLRVWSDNPHAGWTELRPRIVRIELHPRALVLTVRPPAHGSWNERIVPPDEVMSLPGGQLRVTIETALRSRGGRRSVMTGSGSPRARPDAALIAGLRKAHELLSEHGIDHLSRVPDLGSARGIDDPWKRSLSRLAFLAPDIQHAILTGRQPAGLALADLMAGDVPLDWDAQREQLGFIRTRPDMS